jgi:hypothetical protein
MPLYPYITEIDPLASSVWVTQNGLDNRSKCGIIEIVNGLVNDSTADYIRMSSTNPVADSGRLLLRFGHGPSYTTEVTKGAFGCAYDESTCNMWIEPSGAFNTLNKTPSDFDDNFFVVESVSLKVLARKAIGSRDYAIDVVGYSDDKLLNITSPVGGFLQNIEGSGLLPIVFTSFPIDDLSLGGETLSDLQQYYLDNTFEYPAGDHYVLATRPLINSTEFKWYEIPLKIYPDNVLLGQSRDYSMSSLFENIYLDMFPFPSGADIASLQLLVRYAPQNALNISAQGGSGIGRIDAKLFPSVRQQNDSIINTGSGYAPLSRIENIPQAYSSPSTLKTNYSRKWRGAEGLTTSAFDPDQFSFSFSQPLLDQPFLHSFYDFSKVTGSTIFPQQGSGNATVVSSLPTYSYNNIGWRFISDSIYSSELPNYSGIYRTSDWTALNSGVSNFQSHPLYGKLADAFTNAIKVSGAASYIRQDNVNIGSGFAAYVRFTPGPRMSGVNYNLWNSGCVLAKYNGANIQFGIRYAGGKLAGFCRNTGGTYVNVQDSSFYHENSYPLSVLLTYNDNGSRKLKLYVNNEFTPSGRFRGESSAFDIATGSGSLYLGYAPTSGVGFHGLITEYGISNSGNVVQSNPDLTYRQTDYETFFNNQHMHFWSSGQSYTADSYALPKYVDEDTIEGWTIGDFKYCQFGPAFSRLSKRTGRDLIYFSVLNSGTPYRSFTNKALPQTVNSGVSYHTQIENDFLRFNLSDVNSNFYATYPRITKDLPRGYKFAERAIVVETILEHTSSGNIQWGACDAVGPKFIVSLYTSKKEPYWTPDEPNWGLINRSVHYLEANSCFMKLKSTFNYRDYIDDSEEWALFPSETRLTEFTEKYYSTDINDMFLQYDVVYPSGTPYSSRINVHSAHVRLDDAFAYITSENENLNIFSLANPILQDNLNLLLEGITDFGTQELNLYTFAVTPTGVSGAMNILMSGTLVAPAVLPLSITGLSGAFNFVNIYTSGSPSIPTYSDSGSFNLYMYGKGIIDSRSGEYLGLSLTALNTDTTYIPEPNVLSLFAIGDSGVSSIRSHLPIFALSSQDPQSGFSSGVLNLRMLGSNVVFSRYVQNSLNLYTFSNKLNQQINLFLSADREASSASGTLNLSTINYYGNQNSYIDWDNYNYGEYLELDDEIYPSLPSNDEIRGVDLIAYGACDSDSPKKAIDPPIITHDTVWREETCNDGGIFRALETYTNLDAGYSGNYYGIRKETGLIPNAAYNVTMRVTTGSTEAIPLPPEWEEWEYGTNSETNFNNVKLIGDSNRVSTRSAEDGFGHSVATRKDLLAIGAPYKEIPDESGFPINNAGSVYIYRRDLDVAGKQADWIFEDELILPSGFRRDYISATVENMLCYPASEPEFCVSGAKWNIGQEGREFGHSVAVANNDDLEVVVVGAPGAQWNRSFPDITVSGVPVCMIVFTDKFDYDKIKINQVGATVNRWDILYKYFAAQWPQGFQPKLDLKLIVCQPTFSNQAKPLISPDESWFYHTYIERLDDPTVPNAYNSIMSGIKDVFFKAFPRNTALVDSNIPAILGVFEDNSPSTTYKNAFGPVVSAFKEFYSQYSYASGVVSSINLGALSGNIVSVSARSENWVSSTIDLLNESLDYKTLIANDTLKYITSGVGQQFARSNSYEFQIPPASGGRVYIFERENGEFNLVQAIESPDEVAQGASVAQGGGPSLYGLQYNDRFGHAVSISENANTIIIGSPFSSEACQIYERDDSENSRLLSEIRNWAIFSGLSGTLNYYDSLAAQSGDSIARQETYYSLSKSDKFSFRSDDQFWTPVRGGIPSLYGKIYDYSYRDIQYTGTWAFLTSEFAGTSRLGYSVDVNDDGTRAVIGAPTDSFNEFDDHNMWYDEIRNTWASYVNAGAARVFESKEYYPHNLAVEFYKFGNLDRNSHPELAAQGFYDQMGIYLNPVPFRRTDFSEVEIPQEAGLAFIITPEIDAASDEIIDNIKQWLALGDRTLVLVGNDPIWEDNGRYLKSNNIVNKILQKLGSRMRLVPARNQYESLPECISEAEVASKRYNVTYSFVPQYAHGTKVYAGNMFAKGVADIKIDLTDVNLTGLFIPSPACDEERNLSCELPIMHLGDLRAEWNEICTRTVGDRAIEVKYKENWPFHFGNENPAQKCDNYPAGPKPEVNRPYQDPRPILTAAEWFGGETITIPARSGVYVTWVPIYQDVFTDVPYWVFAENHLSGVMPLSIYENGESVPSGEYTLLEYGKFIDPEITNGRDGLLQAVGETYFTEPTETDRFVDDYNTIVAEEQYGSSRVVLIASLLPENERSLGYTLDPDRPNENLDENIYFYNNLVKEACNDPAMIAQLGGWTGRTSFKDAYIESELLLCFQSHQHAVVENFTGSLDSLYNVAWLANPSGAPSASDIQNIKNWLDLGNRTLVITYGNDQVIAENIRGICEALNLSMAPHYSESEGKYLDTDFAELSQITQSVDNSNPIIYGCDTGYSWINGQTSSTKVNEFAILPEDRLILNNVFIPISGGNKVVYYEYELTEKYWNNPSFWKIDALSKIKFNGLPGSGYRLFVDWVAESKNEKYQINAFVANGAGPDINDNNPRDFYIGSLDGSLLHTVRTSYVDFKVPAGFNEIEVKFDTSIHYKIDASGYIPMTPRIMGVSGYLLPIVEEFYTTSERIIIGYDRVETPWYQPPQTIIIPPEFRPIKTDSAKYCTNGCPGRLIEDGPIIVAEELEGFSTFTNGMSRSRIVLISDSTLIQGQCPHYRNESFRENQAFIRSLYPVSPTGIPGKRFEFVQKLIAPERGSAAKYYALSGISSLVTNYGLLGVAGNLGNYTSSENDYNPADLDRPGDPVTFEEKQAKIKYFGQTIVPQYGIFPRYSGAYIDAGYIGGIPQILKQTGKDHLDGSGYRGDLFGYGVAIHDDKIIVGTPYNGFNGETIATWDDIKSGIRTITVNGQGGAGAGFYFRRTGTGQNGATEFLPWEFMQKVKPSNILAQDEFGYSVDLDADFVAIGAPGHDYRTTHQHIYPGSAAYIRKEFNAAFDIPQHTFDNYGGQLIQNIGAVFTYNDKIVNWQDREKELVLAERLNASGYESPKSDDRFGRAVSIDRVGRGDADYTLIAGAPSHDFPTSGTHLTGTLSNAGAAYVYDAMLREQVPAIPNAGSWISARTFGDSNGQDLSLFVNQNTSGPSLDYEVQGLLFTNSQGEIFLEASGFDPATRGFIAHRPYVSFIRGNLAFGTPVEDYMNMITSGEPPKIQENMNLTIIGPDSAFVYNTMNLTATSWTTLEVGSGTPPFNLVTSGNVGVPFSGGLNLVTSGNTVDAAKLNLRIRGK